MTYEEALAELYLLEADADPITSDWAFDELGGLLSDVETESTAIGADGPIGGAR